MATGDVDTARTLLQAPGVNVDAYDANGATLTYIAAAHGHTAVVEMLADKGGADVGKATPDDAKALLVVAPQPAAAGRAGCTQWRGLSALYRVA